MKMLMKIPMKTAMKALKIREVAGMNTAMTTITVMKGMSPWAMNEGAEGFFRSAGPVNLIRIENDGFVYEPHVN